MLDTQRHNCTVLWTAKALTSGAEIIHGAYTDDDIDYREKRLSQGSNCRGSVAVISTVHIGGKYDIHRLRQGAVQIWLPLLQSR